MPPRTLPGIGLQGYAPRGEDSWNTWADPNWRLISALVQSRVKSLVETLPISPANGDMHILRSGSNANTIAVRDNGGWVYVEPKLGYRVFDEQTGLYFTFNSGGWVPDFADLSASASAPALELLKRGSAAGPLAPNDNASELGSIQWTGWTGAAWRVGAAMIARTQQLWSGVNNGSAIIWQVVANGSSTLVNRLQLTATALTPGDSDGGVSLGSQGSRWQRLWAHDVSLFPQVGAMPTVNGEITIASADNGTVTILKRGSDGVVRKVDLILVEL